MVKMMRMWCDMHTHKRNILVTELIRLITIGYITRLNVTQLCDVVVYKSSTLNEESQGFLLLNLFFQLKKVTTTCNKGLNI